MYVPSLPADAPTRHALGPPDEPRLGLRCGEPSELDHLVDAELPGGERLGEPREPLEGMGSSDPPPGLQSEMPWRIEIEWAMSRAPEFRQSSRRSPSAISRTSIGHGGE